ncbi:MAG: hypothetical protein EBV45_10010 [Chloroflexi bacterium]|nr:hypothetical protein [Chloroflexota bacterium]
MFLHIGSGGCVPTHRPRLRQNLVHEDEVGQRLGDPFPRLRFHVFTPAPPGGVENLSPTSRLRLALSLRPGKE